ncbi:TPA_asm: UL23.6 [Human alphaherpesvirus 1]|nr:TPA_asm: UL23.6 [Human alphaherpesvirus 1]
MGTVYVDRLWSIRTTAVILPETFCGTSRVTRLTRSVRWATNTRTGHRYTILSPGGARDCRSFREWRSCFIPVARCSRLLAVSPEEIYLHVFSSMMTQTPPSVLSLANSNTQMQSGRRGPRSTSHIKVTRVASNTERPCSDPLNSVNSVPQILVA